MIQPATDYRLFARSPDPRPSSNHARGLTVNGPNA
jgi:hypothetical protein